MTIDNTTRSAENLLSNVPDIRLKRNSLYYAQTIQCLFSFFFLVFFFQTYGYLLRDNSTRNNRYMVQRQFFVRITHETVFFLSVGRTNSSLLNLNISFSVARYIEPDTFSRYSRSDQIYDKCTNADESSTDPCQSDSFFLSYLKHSSLSQKQQKFMKLIHL